MAEPFYVLHQGAIVNPMVNLILIGPMGAGKTSVGRALANRLELPFFDSDREIEERCGVDIPTIFEFEGEDGFRERETRVIDELTQETGIVLATGGGAVIREENRQYLAERGHVILLSVELKEQIRRVSRDAKRPLLADTDPEARLQQLWEARGPLYKSVADVEISTDSRRLFHVVNRILKHLQTHQIISSDS